jgi:signal transduction histidine kinase
MQILGSLTNRIFLATAMLAVVSIGAAVFYVSRTITDQAEEELQRGLLEAGTLMDLQTANLAQSFTVMARLVADLPRLKAGVAESDPPTVRPIALDYQKQLSAALLVLTDRRGTVLAAAGEVDDTSPDAIAGRPEIAGALGGREMSGFWPQQKSVLQVVSVPIAVGVDRPELLGTLTLGFRLDEGLAEQFKRVTESDIAFAADGQIRASTVAPADQPQLSSLLSARGVTRVSFGGSEYVALVRPLSMKPGPSVVILRSRTERLRSLNAIHTGLAAMAVGAVLLAVVLSYAVARTITRPMATISETMREMAATGDLTKKIVVRSSASWEDEDAKLLAATFNTLTDSIARFQREAGQRERLSSLGRLSTVIAHEIRNPLMIIKASLRTLASEQVSRAEIRQALKDVDEEVARLNRIVHDVLDFARPIRFEYAPADLGLLCADVEHATRTTMGEISVRVNVDPRLGPVVTDAERLRTALVNILMNARHAVEARQDGKSSRPSTPDIELDTRKGENGMVSIIVRDRGIGVNAEDMPRVFDPYFTTKRTGSGLGLAIAKNIIEGMGGSIVLESRPGSGTEIRIEVPERRSAA